MRVEVVYITPERQFVEAIDVPQGASVQQAVDASGVVKVFPELTGEDFPVGVYGRKVTLESILEAGDRVEIYRPLLIDPKEARRKRAQKS